jgi:predicted acyltransferase
MSSSGAAAASPKRIVSLDAARAIAVALMVFMDHPTIARALPTFLRHPEWHGFRLPDAVFPAFIFVAGISLAYSMSRKKDVDFKAATLVFLRRIAVLMLIGLVISFVKYGLPLRYLGVLQRIGLALLLAWPFTRLRTRWVLLGAAGYLLIHAVVLLFVGAPGVVPGDFAVREATISGYVDTLVLGVQHTYMQSGFDPEGILGTLSAAAQALLGLALGKWLIRNPRNTRALLFAAIVGVGMALLGWFLAGVLGMPLNKPLWTPTYALVSSGIFTFVFVLMYWVADTKGHERLFTWLVPLGRNALLVFVASNLAVAIARRLGYFPGIGSRLASVIGSELLATLILQGGELALWFLVAGWLHRRKLYWKL